MYTNPLSLFINGHHLSHHLNADGTQIYLFLSTPDANKSLQLRNCLDEMLYWMTESRLKLYADKT